MKRAGLEMKLADAVRRSYRNPADAVDAQRQSEEATSITRELGTPWTAVLADLEAASHASEGQVACSRSSPTTRSIASSSRRSPRTCRWRWRTSKRLQESHSLRYPMLDSHESGRR